MAKKYMVRVYDCSFIQNFVDSYEMYFDSFEQAKEYADTLMSQFAFAGLEMYTAEVYIRTFIAHTYEIIGYFEFDYMGDDCDLFDITDDELEHYTWHDMF